MPSASSSLLKRLSLVTFLVAAPALSAGCIADTSDPGDTDEIDDSTAAEPAAPEETGSLEGALSGKTVLQAASASCSTTSVKGLSLQIIAEARCMNADAYAAVPDLANVKFGSAVFAYLEKPARDKLVAALKANPSKTMTINSMLRTVAQQYLLYRWYKTGTCGISLAATPGASNHETGLAVDVSEYSTWKTALQGKGFQWLGSSDTVHFDYVGSGAVSYKGLDVKAFQRLWNRNHKNDTIATDGVWGPNTEARMKQSPSDGFAIGAQCALSRVVPGPSAGDSDQDDSAIDATLPWAAEGSLTAQDATVNEELAEELRTQHEAESCSDNEP